MRRVWPAAALAWCALAGPPEAGAQSALALADSLLRSGDLFRAESLYYREAARRPRDPAIRLALGRYLAARGAWRVGAVLMEEARYFGGNADSVGRHLAPAYERLGDWKSLAGMRGSPLTRPERLRADWLARHAPDITGPDSAWIEWLSPERGLGSVLVIAGEDTIEADLDPRAKGLIVGPGMRGRRWLERFPPPGGATRGAAPVYVATRLAIGELTLSAVPAAIEGTGGRARLGLDVLERLAPGFDPFARRILLRRSGRVRDDTTAFAIPTLRLEEGLHVVLDRSLSPLDGDVVLPLLRGKVWTLDARRGEIRMASGS